MCTKICNKCKIDLPILDFPSQKVNNKIYIRGECFSCRKKILKKWEEDNPGYYTKKIKEYYKNNSKKLKEYAKNYRADPIKGELHKKAVKNWKIKNTGSLKKYNKDYSKINRKNLSEKALKRQKIRLELDPKFKLTHYIRTRIGSLCKKLGTRKQSGISKYLGCTSEFLISFLENQFDNKMDWNNHGSYWHIDHIIPLSCADNEEELMKLAHYINLRPLEARKNLSRKDKMSSEDINLYLSRIKTKEFLFK